MFRWIFFQDLKFRIVNPFMPAMVWGSVKQSPSMDWEKIKKEIYSLNLQQIDFC